eukprot:TRINITY_DN505_c0_g1_i4.p1 TRINITY_DN505_c0_g1~~TRINITY_DN505_c0_g1_i4.p1  ORF type:complete len:381 (-),score=89.65 TRINITY_DN505_c0_g1_i4:315-1457(-)
MLQQSNGVHNGDDRPAISYQSIAPPSQAALPSERQEKLTKAIFQASWVVNIFLVFAKLFALVATNYSKAVAASLADSAVDVLSQVVLSLSQYFMLRPSKEYPVGRNRLEALGVIGCSCIMSVASLEVLQYAVADLYRGFKLGELPGIEVNFALYLILGGGTLAKLLLWNACMLVRPRSDSLVALAEDHLNDVVSNLAAIGTAMIAAKVHSGWWVDGVGAILISIWIISRWVSLTLEQTEKIIGKSAPQEFIVMIEGLANEHHEFIAVDCTRAYHFGARFMVEMEVIMPPTMLLAQSHDIALELQHKLEALDEVERAFVHVDYARRDYPEHKVERKLLEIRTSSGNMSRESSKGASASPTYEGFRPASGNASPVTLLPPLV